MGRADRREFDVAVQLAIIRRATDADGRTHCERCGRWLPKRKDYQIDHVLAEGIRPAADRRRKLTAADGQLLCVQVCHPDKTRRDLGDIAEAKRREARALGIQRPGKAKIPRPERKPKKPLKIAAGAVGMARRYQ